MTTSYAKPIPLAQPSFASARAHAEDVERRLIDVELLRAHHDAVEEFVREQGLEWARLMLQAQVKLRAEREQRVEVVDAAGIERTATRTSERHLETVVGRVVVTRLAYQQPSYGDLHPMDAALNLPVELYSHGVRRMVAKEIARASFDEVVELTTDYSGAQIAKRQVEELAVRAAQDFDEFYAQRQGPQDTTDDLLVFSTDGKGIVMRHEDLREATRPPDELTAHLSVPCHLGYEPVCVLEDDPVVTTWVNYKYCTASQREKLESAVFLAKRVAQTAERFLTYVTTLSEDQRGPPLVEQLETLAQLRAQDLEPDPKGGGPRIRRGVAEDRRVSVEDPEMRHGRKTKSRTFNGFKSHLGVDLDTDLVVACAITPANRPEAEALPSIQEDVARYRERNTIGQMHIDRGYVASENVIALHNRGVPVVAKPWHIREGERFSKNDFVLDLGHMTILCPANQSQKITLGTTVHFPAEVCGPCKLRKFCTAAAKDRGRSVSIAADERLQKKLRLAIATPDGRERLRKRVAIEHRLAHHARKQGTRARYKGVRKNLFDARRHAATINLEAIQFANAA